MNDRQLENLVRILRLAYSGELAAAYAYRGHWHSVSDELTKARIREIEDEEWHHRRLVGDILAQLGRKPSRIREAKAFLIGRTLGALCHLTGWLAPMYGAGKLERRNIKEYEVAARFAAGAGRAEFIDCLLKMAEVEWEHEQYFRARVLSHRWSARIIRAYSIMSRPSPDGPLPSRTSNSALFLKPTDQPQREALLSD
ncbi:MAG: ferritin-like domain-containing protein [Acidobacteriota bacterium]|nr:ferritin-like domain-containing protein [Acidobacteriota bacterium]